MSHGNNHVGDGVKAHAPKAKLRLCLVDDDIYTRDALARGLNDAGFEVFSAPGAAAGLDLVAREQIDAVITDLNMPGISGAQLITEIRERWPHLPIVAITGTSLETAKEARELGADAYLMKPFRVIDLIRLLEAAVKVRGAPGQ